MIVVESRITEKKSDWVDIVGGGGECAQRDSRCGFLVVAGGRVLRRLRRGICGRLVAERGRKLGA